VDPNLQGVLLRNEGKFKFPCIIYCQFVTIWRVSDLPVKQEDLEPDSLIH